MIKTFFNDLSNDDEKFIKDFIGDQLNIEDKDEDEQKEILNKFFDNSDQK